MVVTIPNTRSNRWDRLQELVRETLPRRAESSRLQSWRMLTLPFWWGSDVPPPMLPERHSDDLILDDTGSAGQFLVSGLRTMQRRFWISWWVSSIMRGCSLGAILTLLWVLLAPITPLPEPHTRQIALLILLGAIPGAVFGWLNRPSGHRIAAMLDRTYDLDERLVTAIDRRERGSHEYETMQLADAANALAGIRSEIRPFSLVPVREFILLMVIGAMIVAIWTFALDTSGVDPAADVLVPGYYPASERLANQAGPLPGIPTPAPAAAGNDTKSSTSDETGKNDDLKDLGELGKAFDQHDLTQPVANDLASGDIPGAASSLDAAASDIANASESDRNTLADDLDSAAGAMSDGDLAKQTRQTADDIRAGGDRAAQGSNDLADEIGKKAPPETPQQQGDAGSSGNAGQAPVGEQGQGADQPGGGSAGSSGSDLESSSSQPDPGSGAAAAPGIADQDAGQDDSGQTGQAGGAPGSGAGSSEGSNGDPNDPNNQAGSSNGAANQGDPAAGNGSSNAAPSEDDANSSQGSGAGSGETIDADSPPGSANESQSNADNNQPPPEQAGDGEPSAAVGQTDGSGGNVAGSGGNTLVIGGASDDTVQAGNDIGSASLGSGSAGAGVASGDAQSQAVGPAGPDSNHVPTDVEDVVKNYFSEPAP